MKNQIGYIFEFGSFYLLTPRIFSTESIRPNFLFYFTRGRPVTHDRP